MNTTHSHTADGDPRCNFHNADGIQCTQERRHVTSHDFPAYVVEFVGRRRVLVDPTTGLEV